MNRAIILDRDYSEDVINRKSIELFFMELKLVGLTHRLNALAEHM